VFLAGSVTLHVLERNRNVAASIAWIGLAWHSPTIGSALYLLWDVESHLRDWIAQGFEVAVVRDASAGAKLPEGDGYLAALVKYRWLANALWTTDEMVAQLARKAQTTRDISWHPLVRGNRTISQRKHLGDPAWSKNLACTHAPLYGNREVSGSAEGPTGPTVRGGKVRSRSRRCTIWRSQTLP
jgi:hypothetical protein